MAKRKKYSYNDYVYIIETQPARIAAKVVSSATDDKNLSGEQWVQLTELFKKVHGDRSKHI